MIPALLAAALSLTAAAHEPLRILFSNDVQGDLEPCGCRGNPQGGLARRANWIRTLPPAEDWWIDTGDLLFSTTEIPVPLQAQALKQAQTLVQVFAQHKRVYLLPGEKDLSLGLKTYRDLLAVPGAPTVLASNLTFANGPKKGQLIFAPFVSAKTATGKRVALIAVTDPQLHWPKEIRATSPEAALTNMLPALRAKHDLVIVMSHLGLSADQKLAAKISGIDWIIGAHSQSFLQEPMRVGKTQITQTAFRNQWMGVLMPFAKPPTAQLEPLDDRFSGESSLDPLLTKAKAEIDELQHMREAASKLPATATQQAHFQTFPACAQCHLPQFAFWTRTRHAEALTPLVRDKKATNLECLSCHSVGITTQEQALHLTRLKDSDHSLTLEETEALLQFMRRSAWDAPETQLITTDTEKLPLNRQLARLSKAHAPVQCENCHGPGGDHPFGGKITRTVETSTCLKCHTSERAPSWYDSAGKPNAELIESKRATVRCPATSPSQ